VTEALARGIPVLGTEVGGVAEALGTAGGAGADVAAPGVLVPAGQPERLACALRSWLESADVRTRLRSAALERRSTLPRWSDTAATVSLVLDRVRGR
jgi:glycosyltransferase involved in cell wall biosynthesis